MCHVGMFHHIKKISVIIAIILFVGAGALVFLTRPGKTPNGSAQESAIRGTVSQSSVSQTDPDGDGVPDTQKEEKEISVPTGQAVGNSFAIDKTISEASFTIDEVLRGSPFTVIGKTHEASGTIIVDFTHPSRSTVGTITIDARTLRTDSQGRDGAIRSFILHSEDAGKEYITFTPKSITGFPKAFAAGIPFNLTIAGDLTIAGITHPEKFIASSVLVSPDAIIGDARASLKRSDYNLVIPNIPFVAHVPDEFTIALHLKAPAVQQ